jgi:hypothetical protein
MRAASRIEAGLLISCLENWLTRAGCPLLQNAAVLLPSSARVLPSTEITRISACARSIPAQILPILERHFLTRGESRQATTGDLSARATRQSEGKLMHDVAMI